MHNVRNDHLLIKIAFCSCPLSYVGWMSNICTTGCSRSPLVFPPVFILKFIPSHFFILEEINFTWVIFFSSTKSSFIRCYTRINCQVNLIGCVWQSVKPPLGACYSVSSPPLSTGQYGAGVQAVQGCRCHLHVVPSRRRQQFCGGQRGRLRLHGMSSWKVGPSPPSTVGGNCGSFFDPPRTERKCCPLSSTLPPLHLLLIEVSLLPSHPVFLFCLSVMFAKVVHYKQGTHAGGNKSFFSRPFLFSSLCVSVGERVCLRLFIPGRLRQQFHPAMFSFRRISLAPQGKKRKCGLNQSFQWEALLHPPALKYPAVYPETTERG